MSWSGRKIPRLRRYVIELYGNQCWLCDQPINIGLRHPDPGSLSLDHAIPRSRGGSDWIDNLRPAHLSCNLSRGNRTDNRRRARTGSRFST